MDQKLDDKLVKDFPLLYRDRNEDMSKTCMCWGFTCDDGWFKIVYDASKQIEKLITHSLKYREFKAAQVKEKYGTLRFYMNLSDARVEKIIDKAEALSAKTCEMCGKPGKLSSTAQNRGWLKTLCDSCRKAHKYHIVTKQTGIGP